MHEACGINACNGCGRFTSSYCLGRTQSDQSENQNKTVVSCNPCSSFFLKHTKCMFKLNVLSSIEVQLQQRMLMLKRMLCNGKTQKAFWMDCHPLPGVAKTACSLESKLDPWVHPAILPQPIAPAPRWPCTLDLIQGWSFHHKASKASGGLFIIQEPSKLLRGIKMELACRFISTAVRIKGLPTPCLHRQPSACTLCFSSF